MNKSKRNGTLLRVLLFVILLAGTSLAGKAAATPGFSLSATPTVATSGQSVTVNWTAPAGHSSLDWIMLVRVGDVHTLKRTWQYATAAPSGTLTFSMPADTGNFEFRYMDATTSEVLATSNPVAVTGLTDPLPSIVFESPSATTVPALDFHGTYVDATASSNAGEPVELAVAATDDGSVAAVSFYLNRYSKLTDATYDAASGFWKYTWYPAAGNYVLTAQATDNTGNSNVSGRIGLAVGPASMRVLRAPASASLDTPITAQWWTPAGTPASDWIGFFRQGAPANQYLAWRPVSGLTYGEFTVQPPSSPGTYEFRYYLSNSATLYATASVVVTGNAAPAAALTAPAAGAFLAADMPTTITGTASDPDGTVDAVAVYAANQLLGSATLSAPTPGGGGNSYTWTLPWTPAVGPYSLTAVATDNLGRSTPSAAVSVSVGGSAAVTLTPATQAVAPGSSATVSWTAPAGSSAKDWIALYAQGAGTGQYLAWRYTGGALSGAFTFTLPTAPGLYEVRYHLNDSATLAPGASNPVLVTVTGNAAPNVSITSPTANANLTADSPTTITGAAADSDGSVAGVQVYAGAQLLGSATLSAPTPNGGGNSYTWSLPWTPAAGAYSLTAVATDNGSNSTTSGAVSITAGLAATYTLSPSAQAVDPGASVTVNWTAPAGAARTDWVALFPQGASSSGYLAWKYTNGAAGSFTVNAPAVPGRYEFRYYLQDSNNLAATANLTVNGNSAPAVSIDDTTALRSVADPAATVQITGSAGDGETTIGAGGGGVKVYANGNLIGSAALTTVSGTAPTSYTWTLNWTPGAAGTYSLTAVATDDSTPGESATSTAVVVNVGYTITSNLTTVSLSAGGTLSGSWKAPQGTSPKDWVALVDATQITGPSPAVGGTLTGYKKWAYTNGATGGSLTFPALDASGLEAGHTYYFVYLLNDGATVRALSQAITVTP